MSSRTLGCAVIAAMAGLAAPPVRAADVAAGVRLSGSLVSETAWQVAGPGRHTAREAGQLAVGLTADAGEFAGVSGGVLQATVTYRWGEDLGAAAGLRPLQLVQEVYGRGQTWRLTQLWYQQAIGPRGLDIKLGRLTLGEDFATFRCAFQNLTFCGSQPGNMESDAWYNWPVSQWGARLSYARPRGYLKLGLYEANPRNLEKDFRIGRFNGATGVMAPVEAGLTPRVRGLPGRYRLGAWYDSSRVIDAALASQGIPLRKGHVPRHVDGRGGAFVSAQQQVTGRAQGDVAVSGVTLFFSAAQADRRASRIDRQLIAGAFWRGPLRARPGDELGLAVGATRRNPRLRGPGLERGDVEYVGELFYAVQATPDVVLQPSLQIIGDPGGVGGRTAAIVGFKAAATLP